MAKPTTDIGIIASLAEMHDDLVSVDQEPHIAKSIKDMYKGLPNGDCTWINIETGERCTI